MRVDVSKRARKKVVAERKGEEDFKERACYVGTLHTELAILGACGCLRRLLVQILSDRATFLPSDWIVVKGAPTRVHWNMASEQRSMEVAELGPAPPFQKSNPNVQYPPLRTLIGEHALLLSKTTEGTAMVTNFRFFVYERRSFINVPLMMIGEVVVADAYCWLKVCCKDAATYSCTFATVEDCQACVGLLRERTGMPRHVKDIFAYRFHAMCKGKEGALTSTELEQVALCKPLSDTFKYSFGKEVIRLGFDTSKRKIWRMSQANESFDFCQTYPKLHIMPTAIDDAELKRSLDFRALKRFPSVVWRARNIGVVLIRSSQPMSSFLGLSYFSNHADVSLLEKIVEACHKEREALEEDHQQQSGRALLDSATPGGGSAGENEGGASQGSLVALEQTQAAGGHGASQGARPPGDIGKLAIVDCRSVATVWGNSFKGGGTEDEVVYKCSIIHLDLANIHAVRDSFVKLRTLCHSYAEGNYLKSLSGCMWLTYISALLRGANIVVDLMQVQHRPVLVHCSDGWDRTSQICSLSELMMDKYYRTHEGFQVLVEREWLHFGHKFAERGGHDTRCTDSNQMSPVFVQFLDCVYQLTLQYPAEFQFNEAYLVKLLQHSQACLFGTFLHNSEQEREQERNNDLLTASVWMLLQPDNSQFVNLLYKPTLEILTAKYTEHDVSLWKNVYMAGLSPWRHGSQADFHMDSSLHGSSGDEAGGVTRSKSMDDLGRSIGDTGRRSSDPMLSPNQESAAAVQEATGPAGGNAHNTSSSSAEILHYPDESSPSSSKLEDKDGPSTDSSVVQDQELTPESEHTSPSKTPVNETQGEDFHSANDEKPEQTSQTFHADADGVASSESAKDLAAKAQNLVPSSSSVLTGQDDVNDTSVGATQVEDSLAKLHVADTSPATLSDPSNSIQAISAPNSSHSVGSSSSPPRTILSVSCAPDMTNRNCSPHKDSASQSSALGKDLAVTMSVSPSSSSPPSLSSQSLQNGSSLLSERLALNNEIQLQQRLDRTSGNSVSVTSLGGTQDRFTQHSMPGGEATDTLDKLKAGAAALLNSSSKKTGVLTTSKSATAALPHSNGVNLCPSKALYSGSGATSASKHFHSGQYNQYAQNGSGEDTARPQAMTESTDTLVDQPLGVDIKHNGLASAKRVSKGGASFASSSSVSPASSYSPPSLLVASPQRRELSSTPESPQNLQSRRARAASGASRDLSVSPCNTCKGTWTDTGRLRNPSGGGEMAVRRWLGATVATSTTDISDSFVGKVGSKALALIERGPSMRQHLDVDSLTLFCDERQDLLAEVLSEKDRKILELEARLCQARDIIRAYRERQQQQCTSSSAHMNGHSAIMDELLITEAEGGELSSLGTVSNAASDASWEAIDDSEEKIVMWVPDSLVTHCAGCDSQFWMAKRKHHCRNCGKVFCWECSNFLAPVPHQHLNKPQRVCSRCHSSLLQLSPGASSDGRIPTLVADG
ncbi:hypothetical protein EGW08_021356 [Elysia chlorotica]|uniref:phosphatidylinositol-3,5-bisphosphate 3-phosphatase n=1 Tax=Elysia chlorotica TaxID=188477 RepID=A0A433SNS7_ELYCH|nr:hypothetical protein EGW08_021356 [Elysia chlorotica]